MSHLGFIQTDSLQTYEFFQRKPPMEEAILHTASSIDNFWQFFTVDSIRPNYQIRIWMLIDEHALYVGIRAEVPGSKFDLESYNCTNKLKSN